MLKTLIICLNILKDMQYIIKDLHYICLIIKSYDVIQEMCVV